MGRGESFISKYDTILHEGLAPLVLLSVGGPMAQRDGSNTVCFLSCSFICSTKVSIHRVPYLPVTDRGTGNSAVDKKDTTYNFILAGCREVSPLLVLGSNSRNTHLFHL